MEDLQRWQVRKVYAIASFLLISFFLFSKNYIKLILSKLPAEQLHLSTPVNAISSGEGKVILVTATGKRFLANASHAPRLVHCELSQAYSI